MVANNTPSNIDNIKIGDLFITERKIILMLSNETKSIRPDIKVFFSRDGVRSTSTVEWYYFKQTHFECIR